MVNEAEEQLGSLGETVGVRRRSRDKALRKVLVHSEVLGRKGRQQKTEKKRQPGCMEENQEDRVMAARARACSQKEKVDDSVKSFQEAMHRVHWILQRGTIGDGLSESCGG